MKKEISLRMTLSERVKLYLNTTAEALAQTLSACVEEEISVAQALRILHTVLAFTFLVFSHTHALLSVLFLVWFALTLRDCRKVLLKKK